MSVEHSHLRAVFEENPDAIVLLTDEGVIVRVNPAAEALLGASADDLVGRAATEFLPSGADADALGAELDATGMLRHEVRLPQPDGSTRLVESHVRAEVMPGYHLAVLRDLTERQRVEAAIADERDLLDRVLTAAPIGINVIDGDGVFSQVNDRSDEILGVPGGSLLGQSLYDVEWDIVDGSGEPLSLDDLPFAIARDEGRAVMDTVLGVRRPDGERVWLSVSAAPSVASDGTTEVVVAFADITDRRRAEAALQRQHDRLEEFAGVVSHDLRNPLTVATAWLEEAQTTNDPTAFTRVERALSRMEALVTDLLALARQGSHVDTKEPVSLATVAREAWLTVDPERATLEVAAPTTVEADRGRLQALFENCYRNAIQHGGPEVTVSVGLLEEDGHVTGFVIEDDGPGIDPDIAEYLFDRGVTTDPEGTGFGLAIVRAIAEAHGWRVRARTAPSGGARFEFLTADPALAD